MTLITMEKLIEQAAAKGVKFGKSDPYNRLRYYTKMGWLPHMIRKKTEGQEFVVAQYPAWALDRLLLIEKAKDQGKTNEQIESLIKQDNKSRQIKEFLLAPGTRSKLLSYSSLTLLILIFCIQIGVINFGNSTRKLYPTNPDSDLNSQPYSISEITDRGTGTINAGSSSVMIKTDKIMPDSLVQVTFTNDYSPAMRYWVEEKITGQGFTLKLDKSPEFNSSFIWWVVKP